MIRGYLQAHIAQLTHTTSTTTTHSSTAIALEDERLLPSDEALGGTLEVEMESTSTLIAIPDLMALRTLAPPPLPHVSSSMPRHQSPSSPFCLPPPPPNDELDDGKGPLTLEDLRTPRCSTRGRLTEDCRHLRQWGPIAGMVIGAGVRMDVGAGVRHRPRALPLAQRPRWN